MNTQITYYFPTEGAAAHAGAAAYLACVAWPENTDKNMAHRDRFIRTALDWLRGHGKEKKILSGLSNAQKRLQKKRLPAAMMARLVMLGTVAPDFLSVRVNGLPTPSKGKRVKGVNTAAQAIGTMLYSTHADSETAENTVTTRVWSQTRPVLHLAMALEDVCREPRYQGQTGKTDLYLMIRDPSWLSGAIESADKLLITLPHVPDLGFTANTAVRILPR